MTVKAFDVASSQPAEKPAGKPAGKPAQPQLVKTTGKVRADIWLWSVRIYRTRSLATTACKGGHVRVNGQNAKPATKIQVGDRVQVRISGFDRTLEVTGLLEKRVAAPTAQLCYQDHTPKRLPALAMPWVPRREPGSGRPTKRERRQLDSLRGRPANFGRHH